MPSATQLRGDVGLKPFDSVEDLMADLTEDDSKDQHRQTLASDPH